eukprot:TRINITY_DN11154_c0_g2_i1.p1 TRINITY_DN11154_c0_g2~~TRINITY_DN11154_c0_g2_i1.p1  ORF type:complete len:1139 (+),score=230.91 TRINITY_DN11154_c0_g2_i1:137-3553(+)
MTLRLTSQTTMNNLLNVTLEPGKSIEHYLFGTKDLKDVLASLQIPGYIPSQGNSVFSSSFGKKVVKDYVLKSDEGEHLMLKGSHFNDAYSGTRHSSFYTLYWLANCTGLPLHFYRSGGVATQDEIVTGQKDRSTTPLLGDPRKWYNWELSEASPPPPTDDFEMPSPSKHSSPKGKHPSGLVPVGPVCQRFLYGFEDPLRISVADSERSSPFPLGISNEGRIEIPDHVSNRLYTFAVVVNPAPGKFFSTSTATFYPGIILVNMVGHPLSYRQVKEQVSDSDVQSHYDGFVLDFGEQIPYHWETIETSPRKLQIRIGSKNSTSSVETLWSLGFDIEVVSDFQIRLRISRGKNQFLGLNVNVGLFNGTNYVTFFGDELPVYRIENHSSVDFEVWQKDVQASDVQLVHAGQTTPFYWDKPQHPNKILMIHPVTHGDTFPPREITFDVVEKFHSIRGPHGKITCEVLPDGPTKVLQLNDNEGTMTDEESTTEMADTFSGEKIVSLVVKVSMVGLGLCVIGTTPLAHSVLYATIQTVDFEFQESNVDQMVELTVGTAQIDNQLYLTPFPVILFDRSPADRVFLHLSLVKDKRYLKINYIRYFGFLVQEMDLMLDGIFVFHFVKLLCEIIAHVNLRFGIDSESEFLKTPSTVLYLSPEILRRSNWYYFQLLVVNPVKASITHMSMPEIEKFDQVDVLGFQSIFRFLGLLTDLDKAPLGLGGLALQNVFSSYNDMISRITKHYSMAILAQSYLIIGSANFLGNPVNLISNLGKGFYDFFHEPMKGFVSSPQDFGLGIAKGTSSLVRQSVFALFDTASKLTGTIAKIGVAANFDESYRLARARMQQYKARHVGEGLVLGLRDLGIGLYKGITGIVSSPVEGALKEGALGLLKGVGIGLAGVVIKPVVGVADFATRTAEGIKNTATLNQNALLPVRPPRFFGTDGLLHFYNMKKALGQQLLYLTDRGGYKTQFYVFHAGLPNKEALIVTEKLILKVSPSSFEAVEGDYVTSFNYSRKTLADIQKEDASTILFYFKVDRKGDTPIFETQAVHLKGEEETDKVLRKLLKYCQPRGINLGPRFSLSLASHNLSESEISESEEDVNKIIRARQEQMAKGSKKELREDSPLLPKKREENYGLECFETCECSLM